MNLINNDILRRVRYIFDYNDRKMMAIFALADQTVSRQELSAWLKKEDDPDFQECSGIDLGNFLDGLITEKRGKKEGTDTRPKPESHLSNNVILKKLQIALNFKAEDMLTVMELADFVLSKHELSALFRKPGHKNYRVCQEQILRYFLQGLQRKYRGKDDAKSPFKWEVVPGGGDKK